ncbi:MAG: chromate transporter [Lachnospiraceae bacterium]|nr:chromate transporter [Lachnospiraceae bacterium]
MKELFSLFFTFARIGAFTFGGGYAMLSLIEHTCVEKKKWITHDEMMEITVIAESTPGPIAINLATYIGYKKRKFLGSIMATLGMVLPSFIIIFIISMFLDHFLDIAWVAGAFKGIKIAVGILIVDAAVKMFSKCTWKAWQVAILIASFVSLLIISFLALHISSLLLMILAALIGLVVFFVNKKMKKEAD